MQLLQPALYHGANKAPRAEDVDKAVVAAIGGRAFKSETAEIAFSAAALRQ